MKMPESTPSDRKGSPVSVPSLGERFVQLQRLRARRLEERVRESLPPLGDADRRYENEARRDLEREGRPRAPKALRHALAAGPDVFVGEYHMLAPSLAAAARLLEWRLEGSDRPVLGLGLLREGDEGLVDAWKDGGRWNAFADAVASTWPCSVEAWRPLLRLVRRFDLDCVATRPVRATDPFERLARTVEGLARATEKGRRSLFVVDGDFHCAASHLPRSYGRRCGHDRRILSIGQNEACHGWEDSEGELRAPAPLLQQGENAFHLLSAHPLRKLSAHLAWMEEVPELAPAPLSPWRPTRVRVPTLRKAIRGMVRRLQSCCGLEGMVGEVETLELLGVEDGDRLDALVARGRLPKEALPSLWGQVERGGSWFLPGTHPLAYLADLRLDTVSEELAHWLHGCVDPTMTASETAGIDEFYEHVAREALAFLATRRVWSDRPAPTAEALFEASRSEHALEAAGATWTLSFLLEGVEDPERWFRGFMKVAPEARVATIHQLGYGMGAALDDSGAGGTPERMGRWFRLPLGRKGVARDWYDARRRRLSSRDV